MITKQFVLAGRALFTVECPATFNGNPHYTFRVTHKEASAQYPETWFVSMLTGPDNTESYTYMGMLRPFDGSLKLTAKSRYKDDTLAVKLFRRVMARIWAEEQRAITDAGFALHHEGKCCKCGRTLTVPSSVESGIGPECAKMLGM